MATQVNIAFLLFSFPRNLLPVVMLNFLIKKLSFLRDQKSIVLTTV